MEPWKSEDWFDFRQYKGCQSDKTTKLIQTLLPCCNYVVVTAHDWCNCFSCWLKLKCIEMSLRMKNNTITESEEEKILYNIMVLSCPGNPVILVIHNAFRCG